MHIEVRRIEKNELAQLSTIAKKTFFNTFINTCTAEDMNGFLEENYNDEKLLSELNNSSYHYFFATINNEVVGYLLFTEEYKHLSILQQWKALELKRIYVLQQYQGKGVAQALMNFYMDFAIKNNYEVVWLGVWEQNEKAKAFYAKYGFIDSGYTHDFPIGNTPQTDVWLWKFLTEKGNIFWRKSASSTASISTFVVDSWNALRTSLLSYCLVWSAVYSLTAPW